MISKFLPAALVLFSLLGSPFALAWTKEGGKLVFSASEIGHCKSLALEAGEVMLARQANERPTFDRDQYEEPSAAILSMRESLSKLVLAYPVRDTEEEKEADLKHFVDSTQGMCIKAYMESVPESPPPQKAAP